MADEKKLPKPESLEAKFLLLAALPYDPRAKRKHSLVFGFILDWFHSAYGNALASVRHVVATLKERDPSGRGLYSGDVHSALSDLVEWGYLQQVKGTGRKASRYVPVWDLVCVRKTPNTTDEESSVRENANADVRETPNATDVCVHENPNEDPLTGPGHRTGSHVVGNEFEAAPMAPPTLGLAASAAGTASGDGFSEFWKVWPRKHGKKAAERAWNKTAAELRVNIIEKACIWAGHYSEHGVDKKWIPEPANWLDGERWDEDLPIVHGDAKGAAIAKAKANAPARSTPSADNDNHHDDVQPAVIPEFMKGSPSLWPVGAYWGEFIENEIVNEYGGKDVAADLLFLVNSPGPHFGKKLRHKIYVKSAFKSVQDDGQRYLCAICSALGISSVDDLDDLLFKPLDVKADGSKLAYTKLQGAA